jgi:sterol desaturase/sphingolipid hydroxylase (fatty acid hydroxylase superfamily)
LTEVGFFWTFAVFASPAAFDGWLRWPEKLSMIFPSPAHHHVHHSCHPDHIDKNLTFMLPVWNVIFKTYHMHEDTLNVRFGIGGENEGDLTSSTRLYWLPMRDAYRHLHKMVGRNPPEPPKATSAE